MHQQVRIVLAVLAIGYLGARCDPPPGAEVRNRIFVQNNTNEAIAFMLSNIYPDTIMPDNYSEIHGVPANYFVPFDSEMEWKDLFESLPNDTLSIFIFDGDTLAVNSFQK